MLRLQLSKIRRIDLSMCTQRPTQRIFECVNFSKSATTISETDSRQQSINAREAFCSASCECVRPENRRDLFVADVAMLSRRVCRIFRNAGQIFVDNRSVECPLPRTKINVIRRPPCARLALADFLPGDPVFLFP